MNTQSSSTLTSRAWIRDTRGQPSASLTFAVVAFCIVTLAYACGMLVHVGSVEFRPFDPAAASAYLVPILGLYFGRRFTDAKGRPPTSVQGGGEA
jgi:hypothetical protein